MAELASVDEYLEGRNAEAARLLRKFERIVRACGPSEVAPRSSIVYWRRNRVFARAYVDGRRLELNVDLLREAEHPCLVAAFPTTKRVITHRLRITDERELDDALRALVKEAYDDVGPGTRTPRGAAPP